MENIMDDCQNCTPSKKCILHIEKSDYRIDFEERGFLNKFYKSLIDYIIDSNYEYIKNYIDDITKITNMLYYHTEQQLKGNVKSYLQNNEGYHIESINEHLDSFFKNETIIFEQIFFPTYDARDKFNYMKIIKKLKKIHFDTCKFKAKFFDLTDIEVFFQDCEFFDSYSILNSDILKNESNIIYQNCVFHQDVSISKVNDEGNKINHTLFSDCKFKKDLKAEKIEFEKGIFNNTEFDKFLDDKEYLEINKLEIIKCIVKNNFIFRGYTVNKIDLTDTVFEQDVKVKIQFCDIKEEAIFYNTKFKDLADFYQTKFKKVDFGRTDFEKISVFSECEFYCDVDFKYTKFLGKSIFRDTVITGELDLRNSIFDDEANFLDITSKKRKKSYKDEYIGDSQEIKVSNRETARIIKNFYDSSNNIIEANKFYALEMEKRKYELNEALTEGYFKFILEYIIFKIHDLSSNHSQDWLLSLLWIINITFMYIIFTSANNYHNNVLATTFFYSIVWILFIFQNPRFLIKMILIFYTLIFTFFSLLSIDIVAEKINPFSIMTNKSPMTFDLLIYKITIAYLIYQFIISIRQNTRRK